MGWRDAYECLWTFRCIYKGKVIYEFVDRKNILVDSGEKAMIDVFFRKKDSVYFPGDYFYIGLYKGTITETTTLATIPNEPSVANGYSRLSVERSSVGFPTIEQDDDGHWKVTSKEVSWTASGGNIGPINGAFLATSSDNTGALIGAVTTPVERTILAGSESKVSLKFRQK